MPSISKALFIPLFMLLLLVGLAKALLLYNDGASLLISGGLLAIPLIVLLYFAQIFFTQTARTSPHMLGYTIPMLFALLMVGVGVLNQEGNHVPAFSLAVLLFACWLLYVYWGTDFSGRSKKTLKVGQKIPDASLRNAKGEEVQLSRFYKTPAIFLFYRGNWCPFCMAQIKELADRYQEIARFGAELVFISPQSPRHTASLARKMKIPAHFLLDEQLEFAKLLEVFHDKGTPSGMQVLGYTSDNVMPTLIITDRTGTIRFVDLTDNYRIRPEPDTYLELLAKFS